MLCSFSPQGSTLRKRKMYELFLSKVSILGQCPWRLPPAISMCPAWLAGTVFLL